MRYQRLRLFWNYVLLVASIVFLGVGLMGLASLAVPIAQRGFTFASLGTLLRDVWVWGIFALVGVLVLARSLKGILSPLISLTLIVRNQEGRPPLRGARFYTLGRSLDAFLFIFLCAVVWNGATWMTLALLSRQIAVHPFQSAFVWMGLLLLYLALRQFLRLRRQAETWMEILPYPLLFGEKATVEVYQMGNEEIVSLRLQLIEYHAIKRWAPQGVVQQKTFFERYGLKASEKPEPMAVADFVFPSAHSGQEDSQTRWGISLSMEIKRGRPIEAFFPLPTPKGV